MPSPILSRLIYSLAPVLLAGALCAGPAAAIDVQYRVPADYLAHKALFRDDIQRVADTPVWALTDHGVNVIVIEGPEGLVLFDTGVHRTYAEKALAKLRKVSAKPVVAIIYSHHHVDHINGAGVFVKPADVAAGKVKIVAAANLAAEMADENVMTAPIMALRSSYMFGFGLQGQERRDNYVGCCGDLPDDAVRGHVTEYIPPNLLVQDSQTLTLAGIEFQLFRTGGEASSHMAAYLPAYDLLLSGDEVQGPTFPNLHSMRGTKMRDANAWVQGLDRMRALHAQHMVPTHGNPVSGRAEIERILTLYRDAIQYTHDQTIRYINKGYTQEELGQQLNDLPEHLKLEPWTGQHYGNVPTAARSYYVGYISWFSGDAVDLAPTPRPEYAGRLVELMGGRERVLARARAALPTDAQFAAELATYLIRIDHDDRPARDIKAAAFRTLGYAQTNTNWRNFYLMGAMELDGKIDGRRLTAQLNNPANLARLPLALLLDNLRYRIDAERAGAQRLLINLRFTDADRSHALELRHSVIQVHEGEQPAAAASLALDKATFAELMTGRLKLADAKGRVRIEGDQNAAARLFELLDTDINPGALVVR
jgi:alkyl sulfatase BDS1-like metallo-beta-lactamase superfamily hydrolase